MSTTQIAEGTGDILDAQHLSRMCGRCPPLKLQRELVIFLTHNTYPECVVDVHHPNCRGDWGYFGETANLPTYSECVVDVHHQIAEGTGDILDAQQLSRICGRCPPPELQRELVIFLTHNTYPESVVDVHHPNCRGDWGYFGETANLPTYSEC